jgi:hypothetical protein
MTDSMRWRLKTAATLAALVLGACGGGGNSGDNDENKDAGGGGATRDGSTPASSMDAGTGLELPVAQLDDNVAGKPCTADTECKGTNATCPLGACTGVCETDDHCGAGGTCLKAGGGSVLGQYGSCVKRCSEKSNCSEGQDCRENIDLGDLFGQALDFARDAGISLDDAGLEVSNLPKICGPALKVVDLPDGVVGKPCSMNAQCAPGTCEDNVDLFEAFPNGYCSGACTENSHCGAKGVCHKNLLAGVFKTEGVCLLGCSGPSDCSNGLACRTSQLLGTGSFCLAPLPDAGTPIADSGAPHSDAGADGG